MSASRDKEVNQLVERINKDDHAALDELKRLASSEPPNPDALNALGSCYWNGWIVKQGFFESYCNHSRAAALGHVEGCYNLALFYELGHHVAVNLDEAARLFFEAAKRSYEKDKVSYTLAISRLENLASKSNAAAQVYLGLCHENGYTGSRGVLKAMSLYAQAADLGNPLAMCHLARLHLAGGDIVKDISTGLGYYIRAAKLNLRNADGCLLAIEKLKEFAGKECPEQLLACRLLTNCYYYGHSVAQDYSEAYRYCQIAVKSGSDIDKNNLGELYRRGCGIVADPALAAYWYKEAAALNSGSMTGGLLAIKNLKTLAVNHAQTPAVLHALALCYLHGYSTRVDENEAIKLLKRAVKLGHGASEYQLGLLRQHSAVAGVDVNAAIGHYLQAVIKFDAKDKEQNLAVQKLEELAAAWPPYLAAFDALIEIYGVEGAREDLGKAVKYCDRKNDAQYRGILENRSTFTKSSLGKLKATTMTVLENEIRQLAIVERDMQMSAQRDTANNQELEQIRKMLTYMRTLRESSLRPETIAAILPLLQDIRQPCAQRTAARLRRLQQLSAKLDINNGRRKTCLLEIKSKVNQDIWFISAGSKDKWMQGKPLRIRLINSFLSHINIDSSSASIDKAVLDIQSSLIKVTDSDDRHPETTAFYHKCAADLRALEYFYHAVADAKIGMPEFIEIPQESTAVPEPEKITPGSISVVETVKQNPAAVVQEYVPPQLYPAFVPQTAPAGLYFVPSHLSPEPQRLYPSSVLPLDPPPSYQDLYPASIYATPAAAILPAAQPSAPLLSTRDTASSTTSTTAKIMAQIHAGAGELTPQTGGLLSFAPPPAALLQQQERCPAAAPPQQPGSAATAATYMSDLFRAAPPAPKDEPWRIEAADFPAVPGANPLGQKQRA